MGFTSATADGPATRRGCGADEVLARAAQVYRDARKRVERVLYDVQVPGAPVHREELEYGFGGPGETYLRMQQGYLVVIRGARLEGFEGGRTDAVVERPVTDRRIQEAVDGAFAGTGPPLVPVPLLLREASSPRERVEAFASRFLASPSRAGCSVVGDGSGRLRFRVGFHATNGEATAVFDARTGRLRELDFQISPAGGKTPIVAKARFEAVAGARYPALPAAAPGARVVASFAAMDRAGAEPSRSLSDARLVSLDGSPVRLGEWHGSVLVLDFWASWCAPCRLMFPIVDGLADWARRSHLAVRVLSVNTLEGFRSAAQARVRLASYLAEARHDLPVLLDLDGSLHEELGSGLPFVAIIDRSGRLAATYSGLEDGIAKKLRDQIAALVGPPILPPTAGPEAGSAHPRP